MGEPVICPACGQIVSYAVFHCSVPERAKAALDQNQG
jgi:hypothetical protein